MLSEYWEFAKALHVWRWLNDWGENSKDILQPYYTEHVFYPFVLRLLW